MKKTAFISGASRGIGRAIAAKLADEGYDLVLVCEKNAAMLSEFADGLRNRYRDIRVLTFAGDIADSGFVDSVANETLDTFGSIDAIINNAGISHIGLLTDMADEDWHRVLDVNLSSCFYVARAFVPKMIQMKRGAIVQISSMWGQRGASCEVAYSAAKGGMDAFTKALAKELAPSNISVNAISCGVIDTDMNAGFSAEERDALRDEIPANRFGTPEDVAEAVASLLRTVFSVEMPYLTGQIIGVDGGI